MPENPKSPGDLGKATEAVEDQYASLTYEQLVERLEELADNMSSGQLGIESATALYEEARTIHALAQARLDGVRKRIEKIDSQSALGEGTGGLP